MSRTHTVTEGDCLSSIAFEAGLLPETVWAHPHNAELRERRDSPNVLRDGDLVFVPDKRERVEQVPTGASHRFRRKAVPERLRITLLDEHSAPMAGLPYVLQVDGDERRGTTNEDGLLDEPISPVAKRATLRFDEGEEPQAYEILLGALDPLETRDEDLEGVRQRLRHLGFDHEVEVGEPEDRTRAAISSFQRHYELPVTGAADEQTLARLRELHQA